MNRAKTSLPVPVSPVNNTVASLPAMRAQVRLVSTSGLCGPCTRFGVRGPFPGSAVTLEATLGIELMPNAIGRLLHFLIPKALGKTESWRGEPQI